jgi:hypothetical protein
LLKLQSKNLYGSTLKSSFWKNNFWPKISYPPYLSIQQLTKNEANPNHEQCYWLARSIEYAPSFGLWLKMQMTSNNLLDSPDPLQIRKELIITSTSHQKR